MPESIISQCISLSQELLGFRLTIYSFSLLLAVSAILIFTGKRKILTWGLFLLISMNIAIHTLGPTPRPTIHTSK